jgi:AcrR family transcriptional regulator
VSTERTTTRRYAGKTVQERDEERRVRLLGAGLEVFGSTGYAGSAIETICSVARVATRDFYALFGNKARLLMAVDEWLVAEAGEQINEALAAGPFDVADTMRVGLRAYAESFAADPRRLRVHFFEVFAIAAEAFEHRRVTGYRLMEIFLTQSEELIARSLIPRRDLSITSGALLGATRYAMTDWAIDPSAHSLDDVVDELVRLYIAALSDRA